MRAYKTGERLAVEIKEYDGTVRGFCTVGTVSNHWATASMDDGTPLWIDDDTEKFFHKI